MGSNLMRTVTFADIQVIQVLQKHFVLVWHNQSPEFFSEGVQEPATPEQAKAYPEGAGGGNVRTYFCTPNGQMVYYLQGFWRTERFVEEAVFARKVIANLGSIAPEKLKELGNKALTQRRQSIAEERVQLQKKYPEEFQKKVFESDIRKKEAALGLLEQTIAVSTEMPIRPIAEVLLEITQFNKRKVFA
jgi:hypothetical protein